MELDPITRMMIAAKQQILLYQATHKEKRLCDKPSEDTKDDTPDITKFCMETIDIVRVKVDTLEPEDKFKLLAMLENFIGKVRRDVADEWTYCAGCNQYVKVQERKNVNNGDGTYTVVCGNCGVPHHHRGIRNLFERDKCCK